MLLMIPFIPRLLTCSELEKIHAVTSTQRAGFREVDYKCYEGRSHIFWVQIEDQLPDAEHRLKIFRIRVFLGYNGLELEFITEQPEYQTDDIDALCMAWDELRNAADVPDEDQEDISREFRTTGDSDDDGEDEERESAPWQKG